MFGITVDHRPSRRQARMASRPTRRPTANRGPYADGGVEPPLDDLFADPVMHALMRSDGVSSGTLRDLVGVARDVIKRRAAN